MITAAPSNLSLFPITPRSDGPDLLFDPSFPHREELLQFIWEQRLFDEQGLRTTSGEPVEVLAPGTRQGGSGPDLPGARLRIAGQEWAGSVEVHVRAGEWYAHGHHLDPAYDNVALHVVWAHDVDVRTTSGRCPPTVVLRDRVAPERLALCERLLRSRGWVPCAGGLAHMDRRVIERCLDELLQERMERKAVAVSALYARLGHDPLATAYHLLLRGFGGAVNAEACAMLAHALPVRLLLKVRDDPTRLEALLLGQAGMLHAKLEDPHAQTLFHEHRLLAALHGLKPSPAVAWQHGRLRPQAFPGLRLAQFARFFAAHGEALVERVMTGDAAWWREALAVEAGPSWHARYRFDRPSAPLPKRMGGEAIDHVLINAVAPLRMVLARAYGRPEAQREATALLRALPAERNEVVRGWARAGIRVGDAAGSQALLELRITRCGQRRCLTCVIGTELLSEPWR